MTLIEERICTEGHKYVPKPGNKAGCPKCAAEYNIAWRKANSEQYSKQKLARSEARRRWRQREPEKWKKLNREGQARRRAKLKQSVIKAYGSKCSCCNNTRRILRLDHINNDGAAHRSKINGGKSGRYADILTWLRKNDYPQGVVQLLCGCCHDWKHEGEGPCPH